MDKLNPERGTEKKTWHAPELKQMSGAMAQGGAPALTTIEGPVTYYYSS